MDINVFLRVFVPKEGEANVWELSTDYYLHHRTARELQSPKLFKSPTKWWEDELVSSSHNMKDKLLLILKMILKKNPLLQQYLILIMTLLTET
uniref:Uncharacterized protein n=1 Tax=Amphimedon queenslandica TaxID=400682 RepID=A0A1X7TEV5_AMPQE